MDILTFLFIGGLLGLAGQVARAVMGLKKENSKDPKASMTSWFNGNELVFSLVVAAAAQYEATVVVDSKLLLGFAAAGYAGSDFISGVIGTLNK